MDSKATKYKTASTAFQEQLAKLEEPPVQANMAQSTDSDNLSLESEASRSRRAQIGNKLTATLMDSQPSQLATSEELQLEKEPVQVKETGFPFWKRVIIPPNAYVVHTRMRRKQPVTLGLGLSFRYNPATDAYLVVPAAMQTIGIMANCITRERQGINVLAYLQWQIDDFAIAYRKLDFSNTRNPLGIVNAQLREQAEAAIKDKIATMSVEEVLTDKAPIIEELTARLKEVTEGRTQEKGITGEGLGIKIVTVQIREALVSSKKLWQDLQAPYRHQQEKTARISYLTMQDEIRCKELETRQHAETQEAETTLAIERIKQTKHTEVVTLKLAEESTRLTREQEAQLKRIQLEEQADLTKQVSVQRLEAQAAQIEQEKQLATLQRGQAKELEKARLTVEAHNRQKTLQTEQALHAQVEEMRLAEEIRQSKQQEMEKERVFKQQLTEFELFVQAQNNQITTEEQAARYQAHLAQLRLEEATHNTHMAQQEKEIALERLKQEALNAINETDLKRRLIEVLPQLIAQMPEIHELKVLQMKDENVTLDMLAASLAKLLAIAEGLGILSPKTG